MDNTENYVLDGKTYWYGKGKYKSAKQSFQNAIKQDPKCVDAYSELAQLENLLGDRKESIRLINKAIALNSEYLKAHYFKVKILFDNKQHRTALEWINKADQLFVHNQETEIYLSRGEACNALDKKDVTLECYNYAIKYSKKEDNLYLPYSLYKKGNILLKDSPQEALECFNDILKINDKIGGAHNSKGKALEALNLKQDAIQAYIKAIDFFREDEYYTHAIECCNKIIEIDNSEAQYFLKRAETFKDLNRFDNALSDLDKAATLDDNDQVKYLRQQVMNLKLLN